MYVYVVCMFAWQAGKEEREVLSTCRQVLQWRLKSMEPGWVTTAKDLVQAAVTLCRAEVWRNLNVAIQKEKTKEMCCGWTCFFHV